MKRFRVVCEESGDFCGQWLRDFLHVVFMRKTTNRISPERDEGDPALWASLPDLIDERKSPPSINLGGLSDGFTRLQRAIDQGFKGDVTL